MIGYDRVVMMIYIHVDCALLQIKTAHYNLLILLLYIAKLIVNRDNIKMIIIKVVVDLTGMNESM